MRLKYTRTRVTEQHVGTQSLRENVYTRKAIVLEETTQNRNGIKKSYRPVPPFMQFAEHCFPHAHTTFPSSSASNPKPNLFFWSLSYFFVASRQLLRHAASQLGAISAAVSTFSNGCAVTSHALKSSSVSSSFSLDSGKIQKKFRKKKIGVKKSKVAIRLKRALPKFCGDRSEV